MNIKNIDDELKDNLSAFGALGYSVDVIVSILELSDKDKAIFKKEFKNTDSEIHKAYHEGKDKIRFALDGSMLSIAVADGIDANERLLKRLRSRKVDELLRDRFGLDI